VSSLDKQTWTTTEVQAEAAALVGAELRLAVANLLIELQAARHNSILLSGLGGEAVVKEAVRLCEQELAKHELPHA